MVIELDSNEIQQLVKRRFSDEIKDNKTEATSSEV
jgi:hypothetical protein